MMTCAVMRTMVRAGLCAGLLALSGGAASADEPERKPARSAETAERLKDPAKAEPKDAAKASGDIADLVFAAPQHRMLATALQAAGMIDQLKGKGPFTLFAPTDDAFSRLAPGAFDGLLRDRPRLVQVLRLHVCAGRHGAAQLGKTRALRAIGGGLRVSGSGDSLKIDDAAVVQADTAASNGVIHAIDGVLLPPERGRGGARAR